MPLKTAMRLFMSIESHYSTSPGWISSTPFEAFSVRDVILSSGGSWLPERLSTLPSWPILTSPSSQAWRLL
jgi:hypothetical protein